MKFAKAVLYVLLIPILFIDLLLLPVESKAVLSSKPYIPDSIVSLSTGYAIVVEKKTQKLYVFKKNDAIVKVFEAPCSTGKRPGAKQEPGDGKTPDGIFFIPKYYNSSELTPIYGPMAFHLDFPNVVDRRSGRNGTNIWIHGINKPLQPYQSNGCIALRNSDIELLAGYIFLNKTPVIIEESIRWVPQDKEHPEKRELERIIRLWDKAVNEGDVATLSSLYMPDSRVKIDQKSVVQKAAHLKSVLHHIPIQPRDISILKKDDFAVVLFDKISTVKSDMSFQGSYVRLFLQKEKDGWQIIEDTSKDAPQLQARNGKTGLKEKPSAGSRVVPKAVAVVHQDRTASSPALSPRSSTAQANQKMDRADDAAITRLIDHWANSWESGNMKEYRSCYAPNFRSKGMNLNRYIEYKQDLARRYKKIQVRVSDVKIFYSGEQDATVTFIQRYSAAGGPKTSGRKKLELRKINDAWKIRQEIMSR